MKYLSYLLGFGLFLLSLNLSAQRCEDANKFISLATQIIERIDRDSCYQIKDTLLVVLEDCLQEKDSLEPSLDSLYFIIGRVYWDCLADLHNARKYYQLALDSHLKRDSSERDSELLVRIWTNIGSYDYYYREGIDKVEKAIIQLEKNPRSISERYFPTNYNNIMEYSIELGDIGKAIRYRDKLQTMAINSNREKSRFLIHEARLLSELLRKPEEALFKYVKAKEFIEKIGIRIHLINYIGVLSELAKLHQGKGNFSQSIAFSEQVISIYQENEIPYDFGRIYSYTNLMQVAAERGQSNKTQEYFEHGLMIGDTSNDKTIYPYLAELYYTKGEIDKNNKDYPSALNNFQQAIKNLVPFFDPHNLAENPRILRQAIGDKAELREALLLKAQTYRQKYQDEQQLNDLRASLYTYISLDTLITQTRQSYTSAGSKYFLQEAIVPIYEQGISVALALYNLTEHPFYKETAHTFIARNKAITLIEGLQDEKIKLATIPNNLLKQEARLRATHNDLEKEIYELETEEKIDSIHRRQSQLRDSLFQNKIAYERLITLFEDSFPNYYRHKHDYYNSQSTVAIRKKLEKERAVIEFFMGDSLLFISVISKNQFNIYQSAIPENFKTYCTEFIGMTRDSMNVERFASIGYQLYKDLLAQAVKGLASNVSRLTIIPDDILLQLSFDNLLTESYVIESDKWNSNGIPYLIRKYALGQVYASALLFEEQDQERIARKNFLGLGLEYYDYSGQDSSKEEDSGGWRDIIKSPLYYSDEEVKSIQREIGGDTLINKAATKETFKIIAPNYNIIHIAAHGLTNEANPALSAIVLAKLDSLSDYMLRAADIYSMRLNASLVVLSACQTSYGVAYRGEGMRTLSRAFAYAGVSSIIASLWNIPDPSSSKIFTTFYQELKKGYPKDVALQRAKLNFLENVGPNEALPAIWSQTVLIGNPAPVYATTFFSSYIWSIGGVGGSLLFFFLFKKERKKKLASVEERNV